MSWSADTRLHPQQRLDTKWIKTDLQVILRTLILANIPSLTEEFVLACDLCYKEVFFFRPPGYDHLINTCFFFYQRDIFYSNACYN